MSFKIIHTGSGSVDGAGRGVLREGGRFAVALAVLVTVGVVARLLALPGMLPDLDAVNFARALTRFDLAAQAPHFPGYPVYVALARLASAVGAPEVLALSLPGVVLSAVAIAALGLALRRDVGGLGALAGATLVALLPLPVLAGGSPSSDGAGVAALALAVAAMLAVRPDSARWKAGLAGALAGLALGVRPSYLPAVLGLALVLPRGQRAAGLAGGVLGLVAWGLPLALLTGPARLWHIGTSFVSGHAGEWGGTVAVQPDLALRLELLGFDVLAAGLGLPWAGALTPSRAVLALVLAAPLAVLLVSALGRALAHGERRVALLALALGVPYGAWMFLGQNLLKARHALPVVLAVALLVAAGAAVLARVMAARPSFHAWATGALAVALAAVTLPLARTQGQEPSPAARLVAHVRSTLPAAGTLLFTGEEARLFEHSAPQYRAGRPATGEQLLREVERLSAAGATVYVTSAAPGASALGARLVPVIRFSCDRLVRSHANDLVLFHYRPEAPASSEKVL
jgi:hypothetical protein